MQPINDNLVAQGQSVCLLFRRSRDQISDEETCLSSCTVNYSNGCALEGKPSQWYYYELLSEGEGKYSKYWISFLLGQKGGKKAISREMILFSASYFSLLVLGAFHTFFSLLAYTLLIFQLLLYVHFLLCTYNKPG